MRKASELYELDSREILLLELFGQLDNNEQSEKMFALVGYLLGRGILSESDALEYYKTLKRKD